MTARRIIALVMFAAALLFFVADLWLRSMPSDGFGGQAITMERLWLLISARSLNMFAGLIQNLWMPIWDFFLRPILLAPAWTFFGVLGILFFLFGRPKVEDR